MNATAWARFLADGAEFRDGVRDLPVVGALRGDEARASVEAAFPLREPTPLHEVAARIAGLLRTGLVHVTHPRYFGLFNPQVDEAGILADAMVALYNPQLAVRGHAPTAWEMERHVLGALAAALGFHPERLGAHFTSGGAEANLTATLAALAHCFPETGQGGVAALDVRPAIYLSGESHHSFVKIARMTGLGTAAVRGVPTDASHRMDPAALERAIAADRREGWAPLLVVGTGGTTAAGIVDPLARLAQVARAQGAWMHVDAAWGGAARLVPRLAPALDGIQDADSITWDAHKWLSVPMGAGMFFTRHPDALSHAFSTLASYMPGVRGAGEDEPYSTTVQWSRRAIGIKVLATVATLGMDGLAARVQRQADLADRLSAGLARHGWRVVNDTPLPVICFTHPAITSGGTTTARVLERVYASGRSWISEVVLGGERVLRACVTSYETDEADVEVLLEELAAALRG